MAFFESVYEGIVATSPWEWLAVITGIIYVILAARRSNWCWYFAFISSGIYVYLCLEGQLYIESALQLFYVAMAIIGWFSWRNEEQFNQEIVLDSVAHAQPEITVKTWPFSYHIANLVISGAIAFALGYYFDQHTNQANPYVDAITTVFSLAATIMVIQKVLENWIYWIVIDIISIFLYHQRGYSLTAVLYFIFTLLAIAGFMAWYKKYKTQLA